MKRSVWAVVAGVLFVIGVTTGVDIVLHATGIFPPWDRPIDDAGAVLALSYRFVISVGGAWLTARLAPGSPMKHALALGLVGVVLASLGAVATWNLGLGPRWYPVSLIVFAIPQCWAGGWIYEFRRSTARAANAA
jgi:hypothetical protein